MPYQRYFEDEIDYQNGIKEKINIYDKFYYDNIFYIENIFIHKCPFNNKTYEINMAFLKSDSNEFKCDINKIGNIMCVQHKNFCIIKIQIIIVVYV